MRRQNNRGPDMVRMPKKARQWATDHSRFSSSTYFWNERTCIFTSTSTSSCLGSLCNGRGGEGGRREGGRRTEEKERREGRERRGEGRDEGLKMTGGWSEWGEGGSTCVERTNCVHTGGGINDNVAAKQKEVRVCAYLTGIFEAANRCRRGRGRNAEMALVVRHEGVIRTHHRRRGMRQCTVV